MCLEERANAIVLAAAGKADRSAESIGRAERGGNANINNYY